VLRPLAIAAVVLVAAACSPVVPSQPAPAGVPVERTVRDDAFTLTLRAPRNIWRTGEAVGVEALLTFIGPAAEANVVGSSSGLVIFSLEQRDGDLDVGGGADADCAPHPMTRGRPLVVPYQKSGGWSAEDPNAARLEAFFRDPVFRLPVGTYRVVAMFTGFVGECGGAPHSLASDIKLLVVP
jgi:hypothetical protein